MKKVMQNEDLLEAAFCSGYEPEDGISWEQLLYEARQWITNLAK